MDETLKGKIVVDDTTYNTYLTKKYINRKQISLVNPNIITAFIPGVIKEILVKKGDSVYKGQPLLILEAMKMKNRVFSHRDGVIDDILVKIDERVSKDQPVVKFSD
ncbi:MAG TPA: acetyl-CoA carboxylase biotin carboxyl carrier protein subunit [Bacteroidetes bacterium]|nr:acetyl-CoA carboxylase biotin carboxyl carrier protein subunit [Bacteroidota bacterium]